MHTVVLSALAGICGTGAGGLISVIAGAKSSQAICNMMSFAAGVMVSIVCFGLVPESIELSNAGLTLSGLTMGTFITMVLNWVIDMLTAAKTPPSPAEHGHTGGTLKGDPRLLRSGVIMFAAIALHNLPEGLAIGAGGSHDTQLGIVLALMIALHNIPEGMAIAAPLLAGGVTRTAAVCLTTLSGAPTLVGGALGALVGNISDAAVALSLSVAGGAMLYVVFGEIIPQSSVMAKNRTPALMTLAGIIAGFVVSMI